MDNFGPIPPQVQQADRDFEQFVCSACHNLRELLRGIRLMAEAAPEIQVEDQIRAMESILGGMVEYSLVCVGESRLSRVETKNVLSQVLLHLNKQIQASAAVVTQDPLPAVIGDPVQLATVLRHLLENCLKFRGEAAPHIHVSAKRAGSEWVLSIRDNGPGIELPFQERVFIPFKRLHGRNYAGNGLGLAICRKLVERHGGRIWIESEPNSGTTVLFRMQAAD